MSRLIGFLCFCLALLAACAREQVVTDIGSPWKEARLFGTEGEAEARLVQGASLAQVFPLALFGGFTPEMSSAEARAKFGEPSTIRDERGTSVYIYSRDSADVEIVEWLLPPEGIGTPSARPYLTSDVRIRLHQRVRSEPLSRLIRHLRTNADATFRRIVVVSSVDSDPVLELEMEGDAIVTATIR